LHVLHTLIMQLLPCSHNNSSSSSSSKHNKHINNTYN